MALIHGCDICDLINRPDDYLIHRTQHWRVTLAPDQYYLGRAYVTTNDHIGDLPMLSAEAWMELHQVIQDYEAAVRHSLQATHVTWAALMNNAYRESMPKPHVHWHVRPRYFKPVTIAGYTFDDPEFGEHHQREETLEVPHEVMLEIRYRLRRRMEL